LGALKAAVITTVGLAIVVAVIPLVPLVGMTGSLPVIARLFMVIASATPVMVVFGKSATAETEAGSHQGAY
jgi:hypothetical protein